MTRDIERRLRKLESLLPPQPTEEEKTARRLQRFLLCAVAYHLGDPTLRGSVMEAYRRALGYPHSCEFRKALEAKDPEFFERDRLARIKLLAKFGVSWEHEREELLEAFQRMEAGFPEQYKRCYR